MPLTLAAMARPLHNLLHSNASLDAGWSMAEAEQLDGVEGEEGVDAAPKSGRKGLILALVALLVLGGGGAGAWFAFGGKHDPNAKAAKKDEGPKLPPRYINLDPPFVVNFEAQSSVRFLQVTIGVMTREQEIEALIKDNDPRVRNDMLMILSNQTYESVSTAEGKEALRTRCLDAVRTIVREMGGKPDKVEALYFTSFVMQ
jgi:flagellar FliL protein